MRRWLLSMTTVVAFLTAAGTAFADTRQASVDDPRDTPQDINGNYNHPDVQQVRTLYDTDGTLRVKLRFYDPVPNVSNARFSIMLGSATKGCAPYDPTGANRNATMSMPIIRG